MQSLTGIAAQLRFLAPDHGPLLAAVSGGADSVTLVRLLAEAGIEFSIGTVDHMLRPESVIEARFVRALGAELGVPVLSERINVSVIAAQRGWNVEDAARRVRYSFLTRTAKQIGATHVLTGHTIDDQAETVLLQLLRGSASLQGMRQVRGRVVRPLLGVARSEILSYLSGLEQSFMTDSSNRDTSFQRAWVRHELLPLLQQRAPHIKQRLATLADLQRDQTDYLKSQASTFLHDGTLERSQLITAPVAVQRQALVQLLAHAGVAHEFARIEELRQQLDSPHPFRLTVSEDTHVRVAYDMVSIVKTQQVQAPVEIAVTLEAELPEGVSSAALLRPNLVLRSRKPGDRIRLSGGRKKLSDLLIDRKIARELRDSLRVLASGSEVLWVEGVATAAGMTGASARPQAAAGDGQFMDEALQQARQAAAAGELPVGAVITHGGRVIARAHNETEKLGDATAHAELLVIRRATQVLGDWRLDGCTLYVTLEPCPMCFGAMQQAHLPAVVYGTVNTREGALGGVTNLNNLRWKRRLATKGGVHATAAAALLTGFFAAKRSRPHSGT